jgi:Tfp pilus assembly protein PilF
MATALSPLADGEGVPGARAPLRTRRHRMAAPIRTRSAGQGLGGLARGVAFSTLLALGLAGCQSFEAASPPNDASATTAPAPASTKTVEEPADLKYFPSDEPLRLGIEHFNQGHYGLAQQYFRDAVERAPRDVTAWIGLAASYDRLGRFDLADRSYRAAVRLGGETIQILNNEGYSYMLRGDLAKARAKFEAARRRDPDNPTIANNLRLLAESSKYIERPAE